MSDNTFMRLQTPGDIVTSAVCFEAFYIVLTTIVKWLEAMSTWSIIHSAIANVTVPLYFLVYFCHEHMQLFKCVKQNTDSDKHSFFVWLSS